MTDIEKICTAVSVVQDLLKSLCLEEFPCGNGSWRTEKKATVDEVFSTTSKNYNLQHEKIEVLKEYLNSGTWDVDTTWSGEVASLRKLAVSQPSIISKKFICNYFKTLRLISKQITEVGGELIKYKNLEELTLSVNKLTSVPVNLPPKIKILELSTNEIETLEPLERKVLPWQHLGLSYNYLTGSSQHKYFTGEIFPMLLSLDLSYNNLTDLVELVEKLALLPKLKNLTMIGNPLCLIPGYRGFVIDSLRSLYIFDDNHITADEKHHFKGLARRKENILDEAYLNIVISNLKGLPMPEEMIDDPERPEFPIKTTTFFAQYQMPLIYSNENEFDEVEKSENLVDFNSSKLSWEEGGLDLEYNQLHCVDNLPLLKQIFMDGITISIIEERIESRPISEEDMQNQTPITPSPRKKSAGKETPAAKKGKDTPAKGKGDKDKGKKKSEKSCSEDLKSDPPIYNKVGDYKIEMINFLDGEKNVECNCYCGGGPIPEVTIAEAIEDESRKSVTRTKPHKSAGGKKSAGGRKSAGKKSKAEERVVEEDEPSKPPPPITLQVKIILRRWNTAADSLKPMF